MYLTTNFLKTMFVFPFIEDDKGQENTYKGLVSLGNRLKMEHESWIKEMIKRKYRLERYEKLNIDPATISKQFTGEKVCNRAMPLKIGPVHDGVKK